jgi:uncharacterized protein with GYD domain
VRSHSLGVKREPKEGGTMATYFMFGDYSAEALKGISAARTGQAVEAISRLGGEVSAIYALLGEHDLVFIADFPGTEQAMQASVALSKMSGISFTTAPAVGVEDFDRLMAQV